MWALMLPECFSCFTIVSSEWEQVTGGAGCRRDLLKGGGGGGCVCDREIKGGAARERKGVQCMCECVCMQLDEKWSVD